MESRNHYHGIHPYAIRTVRHHARRLSRSFGFLPSDLEDIEQELMLDLHRRLSRFDPTRAGLTTFIARVVENHAATLLEGTGREGAEESAPLSLNEVIQDGDGTPVELIDTIAASQSPWHDHAIPWHDGIDLRADISRMLDRLPTSLRAIAERLMGQTVSELAASAGIPRHALYAAIAKIRGRFNQMQPRKKSPTDSGSRRYVRGMESWRTAPA
ncbi:MAG: sigma-70 family RNA polymerase sigma factor [Magnetococcales bacterium]|nr:sigma-70 family RNA polymerase sigma factor [Magnetococcales bacterium]